MSKFESCFTLLRLVDVSVKSYHVPASGGYQAIRDVMPAGFCVRWPNGVPCSLVEVYLVHRYRDGATVRSVDGGSLRAVASKLSHLIRFCWETGCDFWDLDDDDFSRFISQLLEARRDRAPSIPSRDGNTVRAISGECVAFLQWIQNELRYRDNLIGYGAGYRVKLRYVEAVSTKDKHRRVGGSYHHLPPVDTREPKRPMPSADRNRLWDAVSCMTKTRVQPEKWCITLKDRDLIVSFLKSRRELLLYLLEATGARPGELARLSVLDNADCYKTKKLIIPTLKRRRVAHRVIDLQPDVAMRLEVFIHGDRAALLLRIRQECGVLGGEDRVFIGINGRPIHERTLTSEFYRIVRVASLDSVQSCMSMFRHRFITKQVSIHLQAFLTESRTVRALITEGDYRSILKKVAVLTGHGVPDSLLSYIDLAWEELGAFNRVTAARRIEAVVDSTITRLISLIGDTRRGGRGENVVIKRALDALEALRKDVQSATGVTP